MELALCFDIAISSKLIPPIKYKSNFHKGLYKHHCKEFDALFI